MPKLSKAQANTIEKSEAILGSTRFEPLEPGRYIGRLAEVEARMSSNNNPLWSCTFDNIRGLDGEEHPGRQFYTLNFPTKAVRPKGWGEDKESKKSPDQRWADYQERCKGLLHGFFTALGFTTDSDTDEMIGEDCVLDISIETIKEGDRAGQKTNRVQGLLPLDAVDGAADVAGDDDEDADDSF